MKKKKSLVGWMDYNKEIQQFTGDFYFKRPITKHTYNWIVAKKVKVEVL